MAIFVLLRVFVVIVAWILLFLAVFLGFLTIPLVILALFLAAYTAFDLRRWHQHPPQRHQKTAGRQ